MLVVLKCHKSFSTLSAREEPWFGRLGMLDLRVKLEGAQGYSIILLGLGCMSIDEEKYGLVGLGLERDRQLLSLLLLAPGHQGGKKQYVFSGCSQKGQGESLGYRPVARPPSYLKRSTAVSARAIIDKTTT